MRSTLVLALGMLLAGSAAQAGPYTFSLLTPLSRADGWAAHTADNDWIVGSSYDVQGRQVATVWKRNHFNTPIDYQPEGFDSSRAYGVNDKGEVVGSGVQGGVRYAIHWHGDTYSLLPAVDGNFAAAGHINSAGQIAGISQAGSYTHATLWDNGQPTDLTPGLNHNTSPNGLNAQGVVVGIQEDNFMARAYKWADGTSVVLGLLPDGLANYATGINDAGLIVGCSSADADIVQHAVVWVRASTPRRLRELGSTSCANAVNEAGDVVGWSEGSQYGSRLAVLWAHGRVLDLNKRLPRQAREAGWLLTEASAINNNGRIVGQASNSLSGEQALFVLVPATPWADN